MNETVIRSFIQHIIVVLRKKRAGQVQIACHTYNPHIGREQRSALILTSNGNWLVQYPSGDTRQLQEPVSLDDILSKYARLEDQEFAKFVGPSHLYDDQETEEVYRKRCDKYVKQHKKELMEKFAQKLRKVAVLISA